jgi:hypothetical protein
MALRATKGKEDARSSGAGALARGPAPSPAHRPQADGIRVLNGAVPVNRNPTAATHSNLSGRSPARQNVSEWEECRTLIA